MATIAREINRSAIAELARRGRERAERMQATIERVMPQGLTAFVAESFAGSNIYVTVSDAPSKEMAEAMIIAALEPLFEDRLTRRQREAIGEAVVMRWNAREASRALVAVGGH